MSEEGKLKEIPSSKSQNLKLKEILTHEAAELASDLSQHDKFYWVTSTAPLLEAIEYFGAGAHRIFVVDKIDGGLKGIISQSDALAYLNQHVESTGLAETSIRNLEMIKPKTEVVRISKQRSVLEALKLMQQHDVSSLCIMDCDRIWGNLSMGDIRYLVQVGRIGSLLIPIKDFIQQIRLLKDKENRYQTRAPTFSASEETSLKHVVEKLVKTRSHRLWLHSSSNDSLAGLVTLSDVLRSLTPRESRRHWKNQPLISFVPAV